MISGIKSVREKFAGAEETYAIEALMSDGKALQMGTSHNLGQHFSKAFNIRFEDRNQNLQYVWQTSWGMTTRLIGAVIMSHGDDSGLKLPPRVAPTQVVIIPISMGNWKEDVLPAARAIEEGLKKAGLRVLLDMREEFTPGWKFSEHEMRGVPLRIEIGPRDVKAGQAVLVRRDTRQKMTLPLDAIASKVPGILEDIQASLFREAETFLRENIRQAGDYEEFKDVMDNQRGFVKSLWCGSDACEDKIKEDTMATIRVIPLEIKSHAVPGACVCCGKEAKVLAYFARAY